MKELKYKIIKTKAQYKTYCSDLEDMLITDEKAYKDEIELLTLLIEKWDQEHNSLSDLNPIEILKALMFENNLKPKDLVEIIGVSKGTVSKMLNFQKGLSKETIRKLSDYFKVSQELFNRPYELKNDKNRHYRIANLMKKDDGKAKGYNVHITSSYKKRKLDKSNVQEPSKPYTENKENKKR